MAKLNLKKASKQARTACWSFLAKRRGWVLGTLIVLALLTVLFVLVLTGRLETGFGEYTPPNPATQRAKTLWDLLELAFVPLALAGGAILFSAMQDRRERGVEERRAQDDALQAYLDRMTDLIGDGLGESEPGDPRRSIARARTLTALRQLDGERKGLLLRFLYECDLMGEEAVVDLRKADLSDANLSGANLSKATLRRVNLSGAKLPGVNLIQADLGVAWLLDANLSRAVLGKANLIDAKLNGADLTGANLTGATVTDEQLAQAKSLEGATMPDGTKHE